MKTNNFFFPLFVVSVVLLVYRIIFYPVIIVGGDYLSLFPVQLNYWTNFAFFLWGGNGGLGSGIIPLLSYAPYSELVGGVGVLLWSNSLLVERLMWWVPFLIIGFLSPLVLFKKIFKKSSFFVISSFIYLCNTYILMVIGGGQIAGIGQAYAYAPLVFLSYIFLLEKPNFNRSIVTGLALAIEVMFDLRMTYIILIAVTVYFLLKIFFDFFNPEFKNFRKLFINVIYSVIFPGVITALLHAFWLIPLAIVRENPLTQLGAIYSTSGAVKFFSFAKFEDAFGLLHPNWPENIFGLTHFMKPEFLLLPIITYASLLFLNKNTEKSEKIFILSFTLLGILGTFLAKGANDPFGGVYLWMFNHIPGFIMFRDSTKWYLLIALSYSMLIPYTVGKIYEWLQRRLV